MACLFRRILAFFEFDMNLSNREELDLIKLDENQLAVSTGSNAVTILKHEMGLELTKSRDFKVLNSSGLVGALASHGGKLVVLGTSGKAEVWNYETAELVGSFKDVSGGGRVEISEIVIVVSNFASKSIRIYGNGDNFKRLMAIDMKTEYVREFTFITTDHFMVTTAEGIFFVSMAERKFTARFKSKDSKGMQLPVTTSCILPDGRICFAGCLGNIAAFEAPENLRAEYKSFAEKMNREYIAANIHGYLGNGTSTNNGNPKVSRKRDRETYEGEQQHINEIFRLKQELGVLRMKMNKEQEDKKYAIGKLHESIKQLDKKMVTTTRMHEKEMKELRKQSSALKDVLGRIS